MRKIILDTNVLVSSLIQRSYPWYVISEIFSGSDIELCISEELFEEYFDVLNREKFAKYRDFETKAYILRVDIRKRASNTSRQQNRKL